MNCPLVLVMHVFSHPAAGLQYNSMSVHQCSAWWALISNSTSEKMHRWAKA